MKIDRLTLETIIKEQLCLSLYEGSCDHHRALLRESAPGLFQGTPADDELSQKRVVELAEAESISELCGPICKFKKKMFGKSKSAEKTNPKVSMGGMGS